MGLLDQFNNMSEDQNMGLLSAGLRMMAASGPSRTPTNFGQVALEGMQGYQGSVADAKKRKEQEEQLKQMAMLRGLQIKEAQGGLADHERARTQADQLRSFYTQQRTGQGALASGMPGAQPQTAPAMAGGLGSPQVQPGAANPFDQRMTLAQQLRQAGFHAEADKQEEVALKFKPEFATDFRQAIDKDGKLRNYQMSKDGQIKEVPLGVKPDMVELGLGDRKRFINKNEVAPGQEFKMGQSPDNAASVGASYANANATREIAKATRDAATIQRDQSTEMKLGDDYRAQSKGFKEVGDAYRQINATLDKATTSPAATLAAATKFMKMLDPGSVVRESELGMALAATGVFDRATNYYQTLLSGRVLTPSQTKDFKDITKQIYGAAQAGQQDIDQNYRRQAQAYGLRPEMIVQDLGQNSGATPARKYNRATGRIE